MSRDTIYRQDAIDAMCKLMNSWFGGDPKDEREEIKWIINHLPSAHPNLCDGCEWQYAFGYGECHHCKRAYNDMYEVKDDG